jgi:hypothetical protein
MQDSKKTKAQLLIELGEARRKIVELSGEKDSSGTKNAKNYFPPISHGLAERKLTEEISSQ